MISAEEFGLRRSKLFERMAPRSVAIVSSGSLHQRTHDTFYRFRPRSHFFYLTGVDEPDAYAVFAREDERCRYHLFSARRDPGGEAWNGERIGQERAVQSFGVDEAYPIDELDRVVPGLLMGKARLYYLFGTDEVLHEKVGRWVAQLRRKVRTGIIAPTEIVHLESVVEDLRLDKSAEELRLIGRAVEITATAIRRAMRACRPGMFEYELEAEVLHEFTSSGAQPAFAGVVSAGVDGCMSHYRESNRHRIDDGDIVVMDVGAEYHYYTADVTATFPANGRFSPEQREMYELVLQIQRQMVSMIRPGVTIDRLQAAAPRMIVEGLLARGIVKGTAEDLLASGADRLFFMHNIGHWLGMDVHDEASYGMQDATWRSLRSGMVMTVEPGIYVRSGNPLVEPRWWNVGARVEDDVLITESGARVLSFDIPREVAEIEEFMSSGVTQ